MCGQTYDTCVRVRSVFHLLHHHIYVSLHQEPKSGAQNITQVSATAPTCRHKLQTRPRTIRGRPDDLALPCSQAFRLWLSVAVPSHPLLPRKRQSSWFCCGFQPTDASCCLPAQPGCGSNPLACRQESAQPVGPLPHLSPGVGTQTVRNREAGLCPSQEDDGRKWPLMSTSGCENLPKSQRRGQNSLPGTRQICL